MELEAPERGEPRDLHRADLDVPRTARLDVEERIRDADRHLVAQLREAIGVAVEEDVGHPRDSN
jgi:hypothetical protein